MARYVITPDVAIRLAEGGVAVGDEHQLLAPTLFRSQVLSRLYRSVREGRLTREEAVRRLEYVRGLRIRLLGDRVLQNVAWRVAERLGWTTRSTPSTWRSRASRQTRWSPSTRTSPGPPGTR